MKKRGILFILCSLWMLFCYPVTIFADSGPKPSVVIDFKGLEGESFYATLLSKEDSTGPWSAGEDYIDWMGEKSAHRAFDSYQDADGFYFLGFLEDCTDDQQMKWGYYPPGIFKIALYFPETDDLLVSEEIYERYAFDSYFTAIIEKEALQMTAAAQGEMLVEKTYDFQWEIFSLFCRTCGTILIELVIAWLFFGYREKWQLKIICYFNLITQCLLNLFLNITNYYHGAFAFVFSYIFLEILIFALEALAYHVHLRAKAGEKKNHYILYAFVANLASFVIGMLIANWLPGIF